MRYRVYSQSVSRHIFQNVFDMVNVGFKAFVAIEFNKILNRLLEYTV